MQQEVDGHAVFADQDAAAATEGASHPSTAAAGHATDSTPEPPEAQAFASTAAAGGPDDGGTPAAAVPDDSDTPAAAKAGHGEGGTPAPTAAAAGPDDGGTPAAAATTDAAEHGDQPSLYRVAYAAAGAVTVLHSIIIDGLQKMRHFAKAGVLKRGSCMKCRGVCLHHSFRFHLAVAAASCLVILGQPTVCA